MAKEFLKTFAPEKKLLRRTSSHLRPKSVEINSHFLSHWAEKSKLIKLVQRHSTASLYWQQLLWLYSIYLPSAKQTLSGSSLRQLFPCLKRTFFRCHIIIKRFKYWRRCWYLLFMSFAAVIFRSFIPSLAKGPNKQILRQHLQ